MPSSSRMSRNSRQRRCWSEARFETATEIFASCSWGVSPSCDAAATPERTWPMRPATRTMKNSSRLSAEIDRKRSCSRSGWWLFEASSSTRRLNCSQDSSRLMKRCGKRRSTAPSSSMSGGAFGKGASLSVSSSFKAIALRTSISAASFFGVRFALGFVTVSRRFDNRALVSGFTRSLPFPARRQGSPPR